MAEAAPESYGHYQERQYDLLAEGVRNALDMDAIYRIIDGKDVTL